MKSVLKDVYIFDIEADNLIKDATKIHCLSIGKITKSGGVKVMSTTDYDEMREFFSNKSLIKVGHNIIRYDIPVIEKILSVKVNRSYVIDTLPLSWYLYPNNNVHGLEWWGEQLGVKKVDIQDWSNLTSEEYIHRCEEDVKINHLLWIQQRDYLFEIYEEEEDVIEFIKYSNFKSICVADQERVGVNFDMELATETLSKIEAQKLEKTDALALAMPPEDIVAKKTKPKDMYKKDGSMTKKWQDWLQFCSEYGVPEDWGDEPVPYVKGTKPGNPNSPAQIKNWLFALGWEPCTYSFTRNKETNQFKEVPQIYNKDTGEVTPSVQRLIETEPALEILNGLGKLKHRIGLLKGLIESCELQEDGTYRIYPSISGYTNTLRLQHKTVVNLPKVGLFMGEEIRGCLIADEGCVMVGSDLSNIESRTRDHYITPYDPEYVATMQRDDFDAHIDIAILANMMTEEEGAWYVNLSRKIDAGEYEITDEKEKAEFKRLKKIRGAGKISNFSCTYGVAKKTLSRNIGMSESAAQKLIDTYWERNWSIKAFANSCAVKDVRGQRWIQNPVSGFWLTLRSDKDKFSTVNQSTAVFVFDRWIAFCRKLGITIQYQCHDEHLFCAPIGTEDEVRALLNQSIEMVNDSLDLNVKISMSPAFGPNYAACH